MSVDLVCAVCTDIMPDGLKGTICLLIYVMSARIIDVSIYLSII